MLAFLAVLLAVLFNSSPIYGYDSTKMKEIFTNSSSVVLVEVSKTDGKELKRGNGTGVLIPLSAAGELAILTNNHVVDGANGIYISFYKRGPMVKADVIGRDPLLDLALLSISEVPRGVTRATLGDSSTLNYGDEVYALGHPFGVRSVTAGNITALESFAWYYIISQTPLNPGNSGGPLFNKNHEVIAINTAIIGGANLVNFSIPINYVKRLLPRLTRERIVRHGTTGLEICDAFALPPLLFEKWGMKYPPEREGIMVCNVVPGSPAAGANINNGDTILKLNGTGYTKARDLAMKVFFDHYPEERVSLTIKRGTQTFERSVVLSESTPPEKDKN